jgi:5-methylcytosine-specific restriction protein A
MGRLSQLPARLAPLAARVRALPKEAEPFYRSKAWRELVERRKLDADYFAAMRRRKYEGERLILDHVVERKDGGADLDPANTQWLTMSEHQAKTAAAKAKRAKGGR